MRADLALVGFGHVGRRFGRLLAERRDWLALDFDLDCRIVGIATKRHGCYFDREGIDAARSPADIERAGDSLEAGLNSFDVIRRLSESRADLKILIETTVLDVQTGQP